MPRRFGGVFGKDSYIHHPDAMVSYAPGVGEVVVYRFTVAPKQAAHDDFRSNYEAGKKPQPVEVFNAQEYQGLSMWTSTRTAAGQWASIDVLKRYEGLAKVTLNPGRGMFYWLDVDTGHVVTWGRPKDFVAATETVTPIREIARAAGFGA